MYGRTETEDELILIDGNKEMVIDKQFLDVSLTINGKVKYSLSYKDFKQLAKALEEQRKGRGKRYTVYKGDTLFILNQPATVCQREMGIGSSSFYATVTRTKQGTTRKWSIFEEEIG